MLFSCCPQLCERFESRILDPLLAGNLQIEDVVTLSGGIVDDVEFGNLLILVRVVVHVFELVGPDGPPRGDPQDGKADDIFSGSNPVVLRVSSEEKSPASLHWRQGRPTRIGFEGSDSITRRRSGQTTRGGCPSMVTLPASG